MSAYHWYLFWTANLVIAGSAFFINTVVVLIRGIADLRGMFARLRVSRTHDDLVHKERLDPYS